MQIQVWAAPSSRRLAVASLIVLVALAVSPRSVLGQFSDALVAENSELQLLERAGGGAYQRYLITLTSNEGVVVLATNKDGAESTRKIAIADYLALWRELQVSNLDALVNATTQPNAPDGSRFTVKYRAGGASGGFSVAGVDSLADTRYRTIVRAVLDFANKH